MLLQVAGPAVGLGELIERSVVAFTVLKLVGAVHLAWLGLSAIRHRHDAWAQLARATPEPDTGLARSVLRGLPVGLFNPKTIVFKRHPPPSPRAGRALRRDGAARRARIVVTTRERARDLVRRQLQGADLVGELLAERRAAAAEDER